MSLGAQLTSANEVALPLRMPRSLAKHPVMQPLFVFRDVARDLRIRTRVASLKMKELGFMLQPPTHSLHSCGIDDRIQRIQI